MFITPFKLKKDDNPVVFFNRDVVRVSCIATLPYETLSLFYKR